MHSGPHTLQPRSARIVVWLGLVFVAAVALAVLPTVTSDLLSLARAMRDAPTTALGIFLLGATAMAAALWLAVLAARSAIPDRTLLVIGLAGVVIVRGAVVVVMDAPLANDGRAYQELARWLAGGGCCFADRPVGYPAILAAGFGVLGDHGWVAEAINVVAAVLGGALIFGLARDAFGRRAATMAVAGYAVLPTQVLLTPVLLTDVVYATILLGLCWVAVRMARGGMLAAVAVGVVLGLSQYVRPVAPALLPVVALAPLLFVRPLSRAAVLLAVAVASFSAVLLPVVASNVAVHGDLSVSTSSYGGWSLLMGTNQDSNGRYNDSDANLIADLPGADLWEKSEVAGGMGIERITSDPIGFAGLLPRKFRIMWGTEEYGVIFGFRPEGRERASPSLAALDALAQVAYVVVVGGALIGLIVVLRGAWPVDPLLVLVIGLLLGEALIHTFLEVKPRYHAHAVPLLLLLAAPLLSRWERPPASGQDAPGGTG